MRDREELIARLRRIAGQVLALDRMVQEERYCVDILTQMSAVRGALQEVELLLLRGHLQTCVAEVMKSGSPEERDRKIEEILAAMARVKR
jgi:DNA-binding FrmR family transcriptional regulator